MLGRLLCPSELFVHDEFGGVLVFRSENRGCAFWGVRLRDLGQDDPPVFVQSRDGWVRYLERVSLACVELVLSETLLGGDGRLCNACELPAGEVDSPVWSRSVPSSPAAGYVGTQSRWKLMNCLSGHLRVCLDDRERL